MTQYEPNKRYTWTPEDRFELTGEEFGTMLNAFRAILNTPEAVRILTINEANKVIEQKMAEYVEKGVVKEVMEPKPEMEKPTSHLNLVK